MWSSACQQKNPASVVSEKQDRVLRNLWTAGQPLVLALVQYMPLFSVHVSLKGVGTTVPGEQQKVYTTEDFSGALPHLEC